jgi:tetratricopeptide (TPR) repeat protein
VNPDAYEAYLRGRYYLSNQFTMEQPLNMAKSYFEESIRKDPGFALAYSGLADSYVYLALFGHLSPELAYRSAKEALRKALELDDSIGEAHDTLGTLSWRFESNRSSITRLHWPRVTVALMRIAQCISALLAGVPRLWLKWLRAMSWTLVPAPL